MDEQTYWNGEPAECKRVTVIVGHAPAEMWCAGLAGTRRKAVRVEAEREPFYLDDEDGSGWRKVTEGRGSHRWPHNSLVVEHEVHDGAEPMRVLEHLEQLEEAAWEVLAGPARLPIGTPFYSRGETEGFINELKQLGGLITQTEVRTLYAIRARCQHCGDTMLPGDMRACPELDDPGGPCVVREAPTPTSREVAVPHAGGAEGLIEDFRSAINRHSRERFSDTADFILAHYLYRCLEAFEHSQDWRQAQAGNVRCWRCKRWRAAGPGDCPHCTIGSGDT